MQILSNIKVVFQRLVQLSNRLPLLSRSFLTVATEDRERSFLLCFQAVLGLGGRVFSWSEGGDRVFWGVEMGRSGYFCSSDRCNRTKPVKNDIYFACLALLSYSISTKLSFEGRVKTQHNIRSRNSLFC
jgi:hypothetical protein